MHRCVSTWILSFPSRSFPRIRRNCTFILFNSESSRKIFKKISFLLLTIGISSGIIILVLKTYASLAQLVEHLTLNQGVQGSSPWGCTKQRPCNVVVFHCLSEGRRKMNFENINIFHNFLLTGTIHSVNIEMFSGTLCILSSVGRAPDS